MTQFRNFLDPKVKIETEADYTEFVKWLMFERHVNYHPDTPFAEYWDYSLKPPVRTFTDAEARILDQRRDRNFDLFPGDKVYTLGMDEMDRFLRIQKRVAKDMREFQKHSAQRDIPSMAKQMWNAMYEGDRNLKTRADWLIYAGWDPGGWSLMDWSRLREAVRKDLIRTFTEYAMIRGSRMKD